MKPKPRFVVSLAVLGCVAVCLGLFFYGKHDRNAGTYAQAPTLGLTDLNGRKFRTSDYNGKVVLVNFWAVWCGPCAQEVPKFVALQTEYQERGLQIIGVSVEDDASELRNFCHKNNVNYPIVAGNSEVAEAFGGILGLPSSLLIDRDGRVHKKYVGATDFAVLKNDLLELLRADRE